MKGGIIVILALALTASAIHLNLNHDADVDLPAGSVYLIANNLNYASVCKNCGEATQTDSAAVTSTREAWTLEVVGSQVAFKGSNGKYLSRCNACWKRAVSTDNVFVHATSIQPQALWTPVLQSNGNYAFKSDNGKYLTYCSRCVGGATKVTDFLSANEFSPLNPYAQWNVAYTNFPRLGMRSIKADNGAFLRLCPKCGPANAVSFEFNNDNNAKWILSRSGTKLLIKAYSNNNYLSRCNIWLGATYPDAAFARQITPNEPFSQWIPAPTADGKWTFQADNGKYLSRCTNCATSTVPNLAFLNETNPAMPYAQFTFV